MPPSSLGALVDQIHEPSKRVGIGGRRHAVPQVEDVPVASVRADQHAIGLGLDHVPRRRAARPDPGCPARPRPAPTRSHATSSGVRQSTPITSPPARRISAEQLARPHAEVDRRDAEVRQAVEQPAHVREHRSLVRVRTERADPRVEHLQRLRARLDLRAEVRQHDRDERIHQRVPHRGLAEHQRLRALVRPRRAALDQVARQRERRAGEPEQRHLQLLAQQPDRLQHVRARRLRARADGARATSASVRMGSSTTGPTPGSIRTGTPTAASGTMMSLNRIAASTAIRRSGCIVISATRSGCRHVSRMSPSPRTSRYSGRYRPAWRMNQTGVRSTGCTAAGAQEPVGGGEVAHPHRIRTVAVRPSATGS